MTEYLDTRQFKVTNRIVCEDLRSLTSDIKSFYASAFCKGDQAMAVRELNAVHNQIRKKDAVVLSFFGGANLVMFIFLLYFATVNPKDDDSDHWNEIYSSIETFQFTLIIVFILFATGFAIFFFRSFGVNYQFIFELDHNYKLIHHQIFGLGMILGCIWLGCVTF